MKFLDTSFLVDYLRNRDYTIDYLENNKEEAFCASTISFFELARGELKSSGKSDLKSLKQDLNWLKLRELDEDSALNAAEIEKELAEEGDEVNLTDVLIAGTAKKTGAKLVTGDTDFRKISGLEVENREGKS